MKEKEKLEIKIGEEDFKINIVAFRVDFRNMNWAFTAGYIIGWIFMPILGVLSKLTGRVIEIGTNRGFFRMPKGDN